jgi:hypothetical protein
MILPKRKAKQQYYMGTSAPANAAFSIKISALRVRKVKSSG